MHILHVSPYYPPSWAYGGIPRIVSGLSTHQVRLGHKVTVLTTDAFDSSQRFIGPSIENRQGVTVLRATNLSNRLAYQQLFLPIGTQRLLDQCIDIDVIHLHGHRHLLNNIALRYGQINRCPVVMTANGTLRRIETRQRIKWLWDKLFSGQIPQQVDQCIAVSSADTAIHRAAGIPADKITQIPNGLDLNEFESLPPENTFREQFGLDQRPIVAYLGRISPRKGVDVLIRAFRALKTPAQLVIAGNDMGAMERAKTLAGQDPNVHFVGLLEGQMRLALLRDTQVLVYASQNEIFGLVPFEGLLCGAPTVVSNDCGCGEIIQAAQAGLLVKYGDSNELASRLDILISDPELAQTMVNRGKSYIQKVLDFNTVAQRHIEVYQSLIKEG
ncbi:MAG: glycosyltransferase family 4 protein [Myxococcota bacterium]|nr:glycosyltransferase family 4 protein [Myxococcota bacterium]